MHLVVESGSKIISVYQIHRPKQMLHHKGKNIHVNPCSQSQKPTLQTKVEEHIMRKPKVCI